MSAAFSGTGDNVVEFWGRVFAVVEGARLTWSVDVGVQEGKEWCSLSDSRSCHFESPLILSQFSAIVLMVGRSAINVCHQPDDFCVV